MNVRFYKLRCAALSVCLLLLTQGVRADSVDIEWRAPSDCPTSRAVQRRIDARLREAGRASDALVVQAQVARERRHYVLALTLRRGEYESQRQLVAPRCAELVDAMAWLVALGAAELAREQAASVAADPAGAPGSSREAAEETGAARALSPDSPARDAAAADEPASEPKAAEQAAAPPPARTFKQVSISKRKAPATGSRRERWLRVSLAGGVWSNRLPKPQGQLQGGVGVGFGALYLELRYMHVFERSTGFAEGRSASLHGDALAALGCGLFQLGGQRLRGGPCVQLQGMRTVAEPHGTSSPERGAFTWLLAGASAQLALTLVGPVALIAEAGVSVPVGPRPSFSVVGHGQVARASTVAGQGSLGIGAHW